MCGTNSLYFLLYLSIFCVCLRINATVRTFIDKPLPPPTFLWMNQLQNIKYKRKSGRCYFTVGQTYQFRQDVDGLGSSGGKLISMPLPFFSSTTSVVSPSLRGSQSCKKHKHSITSLEKMFAIINFPILSLSEAQVL